MHKQTGAALIVSLIILSVLTVIGVSALSRTKLEGMMSHNYKYSMKVFQATESAIEKVIISGDVGGAGVNDNPFYSADADPLITAMNAGLDDVSTVVTNTNIDQSNTAPINTTSTVSYKGTSVCPETSYDELVCYVFDITATASIDLTSTKDTHVQTVARPAPGTS